MKTVKFFTFALLAGAVMLGCEPKNDPKPNPNPDPEPEPEVVLEEMPQIDAPGAGKVTIAVRAPQNTPYGVWLIGYAGWDLLQDATANPACRFTKVDGTKTWWQVTMDFDKSAGFKFLPICKDRNGSEYTAWAVEPTGMRVMLDDEPATDKDFNKDNQTLGTAPDNSVVYFDIKGWSVDPNVVFAAKGKYKFHITLNKIDTLPIPAGDVVLTGNFASTSWGDSKRVMTKVSDDDTAVVYEYEDEVPDYFCFKVFVQDEKGQTWADGENVPLSYDMPKDGVVSYDGFTFPKPAAK